MDLRRQTLGDSFAAAIQSGRTIAATLLYLFWEPENASDIALCRQHCTELEELAAQVAHSNVVFQWMTYPDLWQAWSEVPALAATLVRW